MLLVLNIHSMCQNIRSEKSWKVGVAKYEPVVRYRLFQLQMRVSSNINLVEDLGHLDFV